MCSFPRYSPRHANACCAHQISESGNEAQERHGKWCNGVQAHIEELGGGEEAHPGGSFLCFKIISALFEFKLFEHSAENKICFFNCSHMPSLLIVAGYDDIKKGCLLSVGIGCSLIGYAPHISMPVLIVASSFLLKREGGPQHDGMGQHSFIAARQGLMRVWHHAAI